MTLTEELKALEERLLESGGRKDGGVVRALLADEFVEYGSSGRVFDKAAVLEELREETPGRLWLDDLVVRELGPGVALVTYRSFREAAGESRREALRSSVWVWGEGGWRLVFHQGTVVKGDS